MAKILIFEDEPAALQRLKRMIKDIRPDYKVVCTADNIQDAIEQISDYDFDLILSDIQLSDGNCFEIFETVNPEKPVVFITAYNDYAIKAFNFNGIHYLLKPINYEELTQAFVKFEKNKISLSSITKLGQSRDFVPDYKKRFISKLGHKFKVISTEKVVLFYTESGLVYAKSFDNEKYVLDDTLEKISLQINPRAFFRINRQMIVNIDAVEDMYAHSSNRLKLKLKTPHKEEVVVSKDKTADFKEWIASY